MASFLHIGDHISLFDDSSEGYVVCQGFSSDQVAVRPTNHPQHAKKVVSEGIFVLRQQQNYSVMRQIQAFLEREGLQHQEALSDLRYQEFMAASKREEIANDQEFQTLKGREVRYGAIVQLEHLASHKYAFVARQSAALNPDSRRVSVDRDAGEAAWMRVMPRLRVHSEGEKIHVGDPITLEHIRTGLKLHVDTRPLEMLSDGLHEVAATQQVQPSGFKLELCRSYDIETAGGQVLGNQAIRIIHKEADGYLGCDKREVEPYISHAEGALHSSNTVWQLVKEMSLDGSVGRAGSKPTHMNRACPW